MRSADGRQRRAEELRARLEGGDPVMVVDLRDAAHVACEGRRIRGNIQVRPDDRARRRHEVARDRTAVVRCS